MCSGVKVVTWRRLILGVLLGVLLACGAGVAGAQDSPTPLPSVPVDSSPSSSPSVSPSASSSVPVLEPSTSPAVPSSSPSVEPVPDPMTEFSPSVSPELEPMTEPMTEPVESAWTSESVNAVLMALGLMTLAVTASTVQGWTRRN